MNNDLFTDIKESKDEFERLVLPDGELWFKRDFLNIEQALKFETFLLNNIEWKQGEVFLFGKKHLEPRKTAWYGDEDCVYTYAGKTSQPQNWNDVLMELKNKVESHLSGVNFNSVLLNLYRDGNDKMGWHADNEKELGPKPIIASLSLGATRYFDLKHKLDKTKKFRFELTSGMLFIMSGSLQEYWLHQIPAQKKVKGSRINLTFRRVICPLNEKP